MSIKQSGVFSYAGLETRDMGLEAGDIETMHFVHLICFIVSTKNVRVGGDRLCIADGDGEKTNGQAEREELMDKRTEKKLEYIPCNGNKILAGTF